MTVEEWERRLEGAFPQAACDAALVPIIAAELSCSIPIRAQIAGHAPGNAADLARERLERLFAGATAAAAAQPG